MQMSKAEIVVFMTQDAVPADEYVIGNLVKVLEEDEMTGAAYARQLAASDCNYIENIPEIQLPGKQPDKKQGRFTGNGH